MRSLTIVFQEPNCTCKPRNQCN